MSRDMAPGYNAMELMICCAARLLEDGRTVAVGTGVPCAAAMLAQRTAAPNLVIHFRCLRVEYPAVRPKPSITRVIVPGSGTASSTPNSPCDSSPGPAEK